ncbi:MAG: DUF2397 family protein [Pseudonocardiales bacterium]
MDDRNGAGLAHVERVRLEALRYAVNEEAASYVAIMRTFTGAISGLLSDQSAAEVAARLAAQGLELSVDTVDERLAYLVAHGNLARSPRESEARNLRKYLQNRAGCGRTPQPPGCHYRSLTAFDDQGRGYTGQNPASSAHSAEELLKLLRT